jgi:hypothetical protein
MVVEISSPEGDVGNTSIFLGSSEISNNILFPAAGSSGGGLLVALQAGGNVYDGSLVIADVHLAHNSAGTGCLRMIDGGSPLFDR